MESCVLLTDLILLTIYEIIILKQFGIPANLSYTYYSFERKRAGAGRLFPLLLLILCVTAGPIWLSVTMHTSLWAKKWMFLPCVTIFCLIAVACSARYNRSRKIFRFHYACAIIASVCAVAWIFIVAYHIVYVGLSILVALVLTAICTRTLIRCTLFWLETAGFYALLVTLLLI